MSQPDPITVGIAVVEHRGRYLVGTRGSDGPLPGYDEFPGGKCLPDETPAQCACRECREETGLTVTAAELLDERTFDYAHGPVELSFWLCRPLDPADVQPEHRGFHWVAADGLTERNFPEANNPVIEKLTASR